MSVDEINGNRNAIYQGLDPSLDYDSFDVDADVSTTVSPNAKREERREVQ
jgi:hypothetical protein